jgi:hypothetical protein
VPLGWGCGRTSEKVGILSQASLDLLWGMEPRLAFGMIFCVGTRLLAFSSLFGIARVKDASIADNLEFLGGSN